MMPPPLAADDEYPLEELMPSSASFPYQEPLIYGFTSNRHRSSLQKTIRRNYFIVPVFGMNKGDLMFSSDFFMHPDNDTEKYA